MGRLDGVLELGLGLAAFKNVDLHQQGLYRLKVVAGSCDEDSASGAARPGARAAKKGTLWQNAVAELGELAIPYSSFDTPCALSSVDKRLVQDSNRHLTPPRIHDASKVFYSSTFQVRFVEEERVLKDGVRFRMELDILAHRLRPLRLVIGLDRRDLPDVQDGSTAFETVCTRTIQINLATAGVHEYVPVIFDSLESAGFALVEATVHSSLTNVRFTPHHTLDTLESHLALLVRREPGAEIDAAMIDQLESIRSMCLYSMKMSHGQLTQCVDLLLPHVPASDNEESLGALQLCRLEPLPVQPWLFKRPASAAHTRGTNDDAAGDSGSKDQGAAGEELVGSLELFGLHFTQELEQWSNALLLGWHAFMHHMETYGLAVMRTLKADWLEKATEKVGEGIIRERVNPLNFMHSTTSAKRRERDEIATKIRASTARIRRFQKEKVEDREMFEDAASYPIVFEQIYPDPAASEREDTAEGGASASVEEIKVQVGDMKQEGEAEAEKGVGVESEGNPPKEERHVVVLIHGFLGSSWDMRPFRNYLSIVEPRVVTLLSEANEEDTDTDIKVLGFRLASEVDTFIKTHFSRDNAGRLGKLSFVCHSIGSIIMRSALEHKVMEPYLGRLHGLVSLSSPHLGSRAISSTIVKYGMWAMRQFRKAKALQQLAMKDHTDVRETFLYKLSQAKVGLRSFKHVLLISSYQDQYVPYHSARIEPLIAADANVGLAEVDLANEMCTNLLGQVKPSRVTRLDLSFQFDNDKTRRVDKLIGRAAHVHILDSPALSLMLLLTYRATVFAK